jgi:gas vesicle protein
MTERNESGDGLKYFLIGGVVGALAALVLAPRSGKETRDLLTSKAQESKEAVEDRIKRGEQKVVEQTEKLVSEAKDLVQKAKDISTREKEIIFDAIDAGRKAYKEEIESLTG